MQDAPGGPTRATRTHIGRFPTIAEVAAAAGVGKATAARTLGNYGSVSSASRARVLAAAEELGWTPNALARSMALGVTHTLGVIVAEMSNPFFIGVMRGIADVCEAHGYTPVVLNSDENLDKERHAMRILMEKKVDAMIVASVAVRPDEFEHFRDPRDRNVPVVLLDRLTEGVACDAVVIDNRASVAAAIERFVALGHRRIGIVWGPEASGPFPTAEALRARTDLLVRSHAERLRGYLEALERAGIPFDGRLVSWCPNVEPGTMDAVADMLRMEDPPTALLMTETDALLATLRAIRRLGLDYPRDVSLIGFDDSPWAGVMNPPLSMIAQDTAELGRRAALRAIERIADGEEEPVIETVPTSFRERASVAEPPARRR